jgi:hypothetical protein
MGSRRIDTTFKLPGQAVSSAKGDPLIIDDALHLAPRLVLCASHHPRRTRRGRAGAVAVDGAGGTSTRIRWTSRCSPCRLPLSKGALLADEVGLGKTIEAGLAVAQRWAERKRHILLIVPASLRKQWSQELFDKFSLRSSILESRSYNKARRKGAASSFFQDGRIVITS